MAFPVKYRYRAKITINNASVTADVVNFPVYITAVNLPAIMYSATSPRAALEDGGDIRFSSDAAGATQLACEIVTFTRASALVEIHVKVASVSSASPTAIYAWWGGPDTTQPAVATTYGRNAVWSNNFNLAFHYGSLIDDSVSGLTGTNSGSTEDTTNFKVGGSSRSFVRASTHYINYGNSGNVDISGTDGFTMSAWVRFTSLTAKYQDWFCKGDHQYSFQKTSESPGALRFMVFDGVWETADSYVELEINTWYHVVGVYAGGFNGEVALWVNGVKQDSPGIAEEISTSEYNLYAGQNSETTDRRLNGNIDEARVSITNRSAGWIGTEYNNQNSPSTFITVGVAEWVTPKKFNYLHQL